MMMMSTKDARMNAAILKRVESSEKSMHVPLESRDATTVAAMVVNLMVHVTILLLVNTKIMKVAFLKASRRRPIRFSLRTSS